MLPAVHGLVFLVRVFSVRFCFLAGQFSRCQSQPRSWRWHRDIFLCPQISPPRSELSPSLSRPELAGAASSFLAEAVFISSQARCFFGFLFFGPRSLFWVPVAQGFSPIFVAAQVTPPGIFVLISVPQSASWSQQCFYSS
jgi:hypothetical protein